MSEQITITLPAVDEHAIATLETEKQLVAETEEAALRGIRQRYAPLARHNGFVRIAWYSRQTSNYQVEREEFYRAADGKRVRAFLVVDHFDRDYDDQNRGSLTGCRLYLTAQGEWLEIERAGHWTQWQGEPQSWGCGTDLNNDQPEDGYVRALPDDEIAELYCLSEVVAGLGKALAGLDERIPGRLVKVRQRAALAAKLLDALK